MKHVIIVLLAVLFVGPLHAQNIEKSKLKVLYVAQNPDLPDGYSFGGNVKLWESLKKDRPQDFYQFFQKYFKTVKMVYGEDYKEEMSDKYDVTVFDALIPQTDGKMTKRWYMRSAPDYFSEDYDAASVMIAGVGGAMLWNKKTKIDWLCNCLYSHAFNFDKKHPIFNKPYKVGLTMEMQKHKGGVFKYYSGKDAPKEALMWRVQNVDHMEGYPPGIVANPGFGDSPDAEIVSGGPCIKSIKATSLGRHGNFFQWGYRASPMHLTEEGKLALINTIHYMAQFKGQKPFVKSVVHHRLTALDQVYKASDKGYEDQIKLTKHIANQVNAAKVRKMAGKSLSSDKYMLNRSMELPDRTQFLSEVPQEVIEEHMDNWNAYLKYYEDNLGYLGLSEPKEKYGSTYQDVVIDKDLQKIGIANNDLQLLEKCISMFESNEQTELAQKLLKKYTTKSFATAKEWRKWFKKNKEKLFFTETGGYKWMVNILK
ncbi:MAG: hypothetical protein N4A59_12605 [Marinifilum sp.]|jgi:hypothetical protein|nr:hypothetical protein [Marinifilum sp.]